MTKSFARAYFNSVLLSVAAIAPAPTLTVDELAHKIVAPVHSSYQPTSAIIAGLSPYCTEPLSVPVDDQKTVLSVLMVYAELRGNDEPATGTQPCTVQADGRSPSKGTVLLLPGYGLGKGSMLPYSTALADQGYRSVLVDLPAQGESTGDYLGYGKQEAKDLSQLIDYLIRSGRATGKVGLLGISYGAAVALDTAAINAQVDAIVAVCPFARVPPTIERFLEMTDPLLAATIPSARLEQAIDLAGGLVGYPLKDGDAIQAVAHIRAPVLYLAGTDDVVAPLKDIELLASMTSNAEIITESGANHITLTMNEPLIEKPAIDWFSRHL